MTIRLKSQIRVPSNVTIDGRDHEIKLIDYGLGIYNSQNIIITHLTIDGRFRTFSQAINIANYSHTVWIDHLDLSRFSDRLVNVKNGSTNVTLSWNRFHNHNKVMLLNNIISSNLFKYYKRDSQSRVTLHHNYFFNTVQRNPRAQFGIFHLYNNLIENWDLYGMSFSLEAHVLMEGNIFINKKNRPCREPKYFFTVEGEIVNYCHSLKEAPVRSALPNGDSDRQRYNNTKKKYRYTHGVKAFIKTRDNLYLDDARQVLNNYRTYKVAMPPYRYCYEKPSGALRDRIRRFAGNTRKDFVARQNAQTCSRQ